MEVPKTVNRHIILIAAASLILFGISWRLSPHVPNFAPIGAIALVASMALGWRTSLLVVAAILMVSDFFIGFYPGAEWTWLGFGLIAGFGFLIRKVPFVWKLPAGTFGASGIFFIVSNFGTWVASGMYSHDPAGLVQCYVMALPFLRATLMSDVIFTAALLAVYGGATYAVSQQSTLPLLRFNGNKQEQAAS